MDAPDKEDCDRTGRRLRGALQRGPAGRTRDQGRRGPWPGVCPRPPGNASRQRRTIDTAQSVLWRTAARTACESSRAWPTGQ